MRILQIVPEVRTGAGVEAVAFHLEQAWRRAGVPVQRFTLRDAHGGWLPSPGGGLPGRLTVMARVVWFSTVGTVCARRLLRRLPADTVAVCHNDALAGDVYVNHGIVLESMRARGNPALRMVRNPLHLFTFVRDWVRYRTPTHPYVVNLTERESDALERTYGRIRPRRVVIGNGVDTARFTPDAAARAAVRADLGLPADAVVGVFVGHEYDRKGLPAALGALARLPGHVHLLVVGGTPEMVAVASAKAERLGVGARVRFVGRQADPRPFLQAGDLFVFPSKYEAYPLVVLEALASGLPVVATPVGSIPDLIEDGHNGWVTGFTADEVRAGIERYLAAEPRALAQAARATGLERSWDAVAGRYLALFETILAERRP